MTRSSLRIQEDPPHCDNTSSVPRTSRSSRTNPAASPFSSSDKENSSSAKPDKGYNNGKESRNGNTRLSELNPSQKLHNRILEEEADKDSYDPDQDPEERRRVKKEYRTLHRKLQDSKQEYLQPNSTGIKDTFLQAEELFKNVKQTSDATLDSRLLVAAADLTLKKATNLTFGKGGISIDTDEFVGKCMTFMRSHGGEARPRSQSEDGDDADDDDLDWARLGREAAFKGNKRPAATDFLLGPMSVTKRIRLVKQRRQGLKRGNATMVRPVEIEHNGEEKGPENNANTSLRLVRSIHTVLEGYFAEHPEVADAGLNLFKAVVNPNSFGQTIENIFYLSFLVKDGFICVQEDDNELPIIFMADPPGAEERQTMTVNRSQVIFSMTMHHWQQAIKVFDIHSSIIPTRETQPESVGVTGWYS